MVFVATLTPASSHPFLPKVAPASPPSPSLNRRTRSLDPTPTPSTINTRTKISGGKKTRTRPAFDHPWWKATPHTLSPVEEPQEFIEGSETDNSRQQQCRRCPPTRRHNSSNDLLPGNRVAPAADPPPKPECIGPYIILKTLGHGSFSHVKLAVSSRDGSRVALKLLPKISATAPSAPSSQHHNAHNEEHLLPTLSHPNIVRLLSTFSTPTHDILVLEYCPNGELYDLITKHPNQLNLHTIRRIFREIVSAVAYLHAHNIVHRDLKLENIVLDSSNTAKLTDLNLATVINPSQPLLKTPCGSQEYAAPEIVQAQPYDGRKTDVWALGVILFALLTGELPFTVRYGERPNKVLHRIARGDYRWPKGSKVNEEAKDLVSKMLCLNPSKRATVEDILGHPWLRGSLREVL